jgi:hypothetical protein
MAVTLTQPLCLGSSGSIVRTLQSQLNSSGLSLGPTLGVDGSFGKRTHVAVIAFQRRKGLKADGVVGRKTAAALGWTYSPRDEKPYVLTYEKPPLPAVTPPVVVVAEAIKLGMYELTERMADDLWLAFSNPNDDPTFGEFMGRVHSQDSSLNGKQFKQRVLGVKSLIFEYRQLSNLLDRLGTLSESEPDNIPNQLRNSFAAFVRGVLSVCQAMDFYYGITERCRKRLNSLPSQSIVSKVEGVLKGERAVHFAIAEIQMAFQITTTAVMFDKAKSVDRPTLEWLEKFDYHPQAKIP